MEFDVDKVRKDFPILSQEVHGKPIAYFDSGATTQKPLQVIETVRKYYAEKNASIHRGIHHLSEKSTETYEKARETVLDFTLLSFSWWIKRLVIRLELRCSFWILE